MNKWLIRTGYVLIIIGVLLLTLIADLLPVELFVESNGIAQKNGEVTFYKIVPGEHSHLSASTMLFLGFVLVLFGKLSKSKKNS